MFVWMQLCETYSNDLVPPAHGRACNKSKGRSLLRDLAPAHPISRRRGSVTDSQRRIPDFFRTCGGEPAFPCSSVTFPLRKPLWSHPSRSSCLNPSRTPLPTLSASPACSLLLEDLSSVELNFTPDLAKDKGFLKILACGNRVLIVEMQAGKDCVTCGQ
jgi:hypothetical protein